MVNNDTMRLIAGTANPQLAQEISDHLGVPLTEGTTKSFADGAATIVFARRTRVRCLHTSHYLCLVARPRRGFRADRRECSRLRRVRRPADLLGAHPAAAPRNRGPC